MKIFIIILILLTCIKLNAQNDQNVRKQEALVTIGFLQGGGSLIGFDIEGLITKRIGLQAGCGLLGYGCAVTYHLKKDDIKSPAIAMNYWHQGLWGSYVQGLVGPTFVYRAWNILSLQLGFGKLVDKGPKYDEQIDGEHQIVLTFRVGIFIKAGNKKK